MSKIKLSASRLKTLSSCSWIYWCNYVLDLPKDSNTGQIMGSCVHNVFEYLGGEKDREQFKKIIEAGTIKVSEKIEKDVIDFLMKNGMEPESMVVSSSKESLTCFELVDRMILEGLSHDFFGDNFENLKEAHSEIKFDIPKNESGKAYHIYGFIDKLFIYKDGIHAKIRDYKSSKNKFEGKDLDYNVQSLMYQLAVRTLYPSLEQTETEFVFLQFKNGTGIVNIDPVCNTELEGFEFYLTEVQKVVDNFTYEKAISNLSKSKGYLPKYDGFGGMVQCGKNKTPDELSPDGKKKWGCSLKFAGFYWVIQDKNGKTVDSKNSKEELRELKEGESIVKKIYEGCPAWKNLEYNSNFLKKHLTSF